MKEVRNKYLLVSVIALTIAISFVSAYTPEQDQIICQKVYYFLLTNINGYTQEQLIGLTQIIPKVNLTQEELQSYITNYNTKCYLPGYSDTPPKKQLVVINIDAINDVMEPKTCTTKIRNNPFFEAYIPIPETFIGENVSCSAIENWKWIVGLEQRGEDLYLVGIAKLWWLMVLGLAIVIRVIFVEMREVKTIRPHISRP